MPAASVCPHHTSIKDGMYWINVSFQADIPFKFIIIKFKSHHPLKIHNWMTYDICMICVLFAVETDVSEYHVLVCHLEQYNCHLCHIFMCNP